MFQIHQPDVVLLDLVLPDMNGTEVLRRLRQNTLGKSLPIIVISAQGEVDPSEALRGTVHIAKAGGVMPVETTQLIQVVLDMSTRLGACEETTSGHKAAEG